MNASGDWYVINTYTGKEKKVKQLIESMGFESLEVCNPGRAVIERKNNELKIKIKPIFEGYIFVRGNLDVMKFICITGLSDVIGFVRENLVPVSVAETHIIKLLETAVKFPDNALSESKVSIGENGIEITEGPLMGFESFISRTALRRGRVYMNLSLFGNQLTVAMPAMMAAN
ncbi:MAG: hypothetical protein JW903_01295 [Clostridia bacterium]|nr:hypothetical protein [Clostridia bacterium]